MEGVSSSTPASIGYLAVSNWRPFQRAHCATTAWPAQCMHLAMLLWLRRGGLGPRTDDLKFDPNFDPLSGDDYERRRPKYDPGHAAEPDFEIGRTLAKPSERF